GLHRPPPALALMSGEAGQAAPPASLPHVTSVQVSPDAGTSFTTEPSAADGPALATRIVYTISSPPSTAPVPLVLETDRSARGTGMTSSTSSPTRLSRLLVPERLAAAFWWWTRVAEGTLTEIC